jgi:hypothetical protein
MHHIMYDKHMNTIVDRVSYIAAMHNITVS